MTAYMPYSKVAPVTDDVNALRIELHRVREVYGRGSSQGLEAFNRLAAAAARSGHPLSSLQKHSPNEAERFFAQTVQGPDGHVYWVGARDFARNDGLRRMPRRWWWEHANGPLRVGDSVYPICEDRHCINPEHCVLQDRRARHMRYTDDQILGALQVKAMRLGRTPKRDEWESARWSPSVALMQMRFGSWTKAVSAAGLKNAVPTVRTTPESSIAMLRAAREFLGRWPTQRDMEKNASLRAHLQARDLPYGVSSACRHFGTWMEAQRQAGR